MGVGLGQIPLGSNGPSLETLWRKGGSRQESDGLEYGVARVCCTPDSVQMLPWVCSSWQIHFCPSLPEERTAFQSVIRSSNKQLKSPAHPLEPNSFQIPLGRMHRMTPPNLASVPSTRLGSGPSRLGHLGRLGRLGIVSRLWFGMALTPLGGLGQTVRTILLARQEVSSQLRGFASAHHHYQTCRGAAEGQEEVQRGAEGVVV